MRVFYIFRSITTLIRGLSILLGSILRLVFNFTRSMPKYSQLVGHKSSKIKANAHSIKYAEYEAHTRAMQKAYFAEQDRLKKEQEKREREEQFKKYLQAEEQRLIEEQRRREEIRKSILQA